MTLTENLIRLLSVPQVCSACRQQAPAGDVRHVDLDAACDRGYGGDGAVPVAMDDLVLCEICIRQAAALVDLGDLTELRSQLEGVQKKLKQETYRADAADGYAAKLEDALDARPVAVSAPRKRGRPPKEG